MKITLLVVGRVGPLMAEAVAEFERRAARYWSLDVVEVKEERARKSASEEQIRDAESRRLRERGRPLVIVAHQLRTREPMLLDADVECRTVREHGAHERALW